MATRVHPFLLQPNAINNITTEQVQTISQNQWIVDIIKSELECDEAEAGSVITEVLYNMKIGEASEFAEGVNYLAGYILETACQHLGHKIDYGQTLYRDSRDQVSELSALLYTQADITGTATKKSNLLGLRIDLDWEFPEILYLQTEEINEFLDEFKDNPYLVSLLQNLLQNLDPSEFKKLVSGYITEDELHNLIIQTGNPRLKNPYKTPAERLTYDSAYLYWLLLAMQEENDLFVFVH